MYHFDCECGETLNVRLSQAGMAVRCPRCQRTPTVPRVSELKRRSGDETPHLSDPDKLALAIKDRKQPFAGNCQLCAKRPASIRRTITFEFLVKRDVSDHEGIQPGMALSGPGLALVIGDATEYRRKLRFPLLFCDQCHGDFTERYDRSSSSGFAKSIVLFLLLAPVVIGILIFAAVVPCITVPAAILIMAMIIRHQTRKKVDPFIFETLRRIPLVGVVVSAEDEYQIDVDDPRPYVADCNLIG